MGYGSSVEGTLAMKLRRIDSNGLYNHDLTELADLRKRLTASLWFDVPEWNDEAEAFLTNEFHFHSIRITECRNRNHVPRVHAYPDHPCSWCTHLSSLERPRALSELDQFIGADFQVSGARADQPEGAPWRPRCARPKQQRSASGGRRTITTSDRPYVSDRVLDHMAGRELIGEIGEVGLPEQRGMADVGRGSVRVSSQPFAARHQLLTIKTMGAGNWRSNDGQSAGQDLHRPRA